LKRAGIRQGYITFLLFRQIKPTPGVEGRAHVRESEQFFFTFVELRFSSVRVFGGLRGEEGIVGGVCSYQSILRFTQAFYRVAQCFSYLRLRLDLHCSILLTSR